jgi:hypothetical protein
MKGETHMEKEELEEILESEDFGIYYEWFKNLENGDDISITYGWQDFIEALVYDYERLKEKEKKENE